MLCQAHLCEKVKIEDVKLTLEEFFEEFTNPFNETAARISMHDIKVVPSNTMNVATFASLLC